MPRQDDPLRARGANETPGRTTRSATQDRHHVPRDLYARRLCPPLHAPPATSGPAASSSGDAVTQGQMRPTTLPIPIPIPIPSAHAPPDARPRLQIYDSSPVHVPSHVLLVLLRLSILQ